MQDFDFDQEADDISAFVFALGHAEDIESAAVCLDFVIFMATDLRERIQQDLARKQLAESFGRSQAAREALREVPGN